MKTLKSEEVNLLEYQTISDAQSQIPIFPKMCKIKNDCTNLLTIFVRVNLK